MSKQIDKEATINNIVAGDNNNQMEDINWSQLHAKSSMRYGVQFLIQTANRCNVELVYK